ncbi:vesicle coat component [Naganishia albida]|nr:vesicle coat component [Naganishia albida]
MSIVASSHGFTTAFLPVKRAAAINSAGRDPPTFRSKSSDSPSAGARNTYAMSTSFRRTVLLLLGTLLCLIGQTNAIKFELEASRNPTPKCIWNFANAHTLVIVTTNVSPGTSSDTSGGSDQIVDLEIIDGSHAGSKYLTKKNIKAETRMAITTHESADVGVCITNRLSPGARGGDHKRIIELDVDIGADAMDYNAIANQESLSILEVEMRKLEGVVKEIVDELGYLQKRESRMRDTNESTNSRVQNFSLLTLFVLIGLGAWQILHLRSFFKRKYLID